LGDDGHDIVAAYGFIRSLGRVSQTPMNALEAKIHQMIEADGPISVALYMALCLGDSEHGYYMRHEAFGAKGDFITAPEISQLFGEIIGVFLALSLDQIEAGKPVTLVELGPGRGVLMADVLRTLKQLRPAHFAILNVALVETSPRLRGLQAAAVANYKAPVFHDDIFTLPAGTQLHIVGNEFLDALPMRQFVKIETKWRERMVTMQDGRLAFCLGAATLAPDELPVGAAEAEDGAIFEIAPARTAIVEHLAQRLQNQGGTALLIDYGHMKSGFGDTFQAMRAHGFEPVLEAPGKVDLTSHVDFEALQKTALAAGCEVGLKTQGEFLVELGLLARAGALGAGKSFDIQTGIEAAVDRLAGPDQMGSLFKVLCLAPSKPLPQPFGNGNQRP
jgi:NADH dehydrogenase [ubiquinone] 1 alpha subcomplex assembly factor 7